MVRLRPPSSAAFPPTLIQVNKEFHGGGRKRRHERRNQRRDPLSHRFVDQSGDAAAGFGEAEFGNANLLAADALG
jgi:hypothetical protein